MTRRTRTLRLAVLKFAADFLEVESRRGRLPPELAQAGADAEKELRNIASFLRWKWLRMTATDERRRRKRSLRSTAQAGIRSDDKGGA